MAASFGLLWLAAHGKIDAGRWLVPCGFKQRFGLPCPTCGMTTSTFAFVRGEFWGRDGAFYIQPAAALMCCIALIVAICAFIIAVFGLYSRILENFFAEIKVKHMVLALLITIAAGWAVTLSRALAAK